MAVSGRLKLAGLNPAIRAAAEWCLDVADYYGIPVTVTSGYRSMDEQQRLRANFERCVSSGQYPTGEGCHYPANKPGESAHNYGLAWDSVVSAEWQAAWDYIRQYAGFKVLASTDEPHAEYPNWEAYVFNRPR